jgi:hypothetical protein
MADNMSGDAPKLFERVASRYASQSTVTRGTGFGSSPGLRVHGRIFAMLSGDALVVKLPRDHVDQLVASGIATRFDPGHGRVMKEWLTVSVDHADDWEQLCDEALAYVSGRD